MSLADDARTAARFVRGLRSFLAEPLSPADCRRRVTEQLRERSGSFLRLLERGVFGNPKSPYRALLQLARISENDVVRLVETGGVEGALAALYDAGVFVSIDEFKGRRPIERGGRRLTVAAADFDSPHLTAHYEGETGGSRGTRTRLVFDLDLLVHEAAAMHFFNEAFAIDGRAIGLWRPVPPGSAGLKNVLRFAKLGLTSARWFSQNQPGLRHNSFKHGLFLNAALAASRLARRPIPTPEHVPLARPDPILEWLRAEAAAGRPAMLDAPVSCAVRIARLARERSVDIGGTLFRIAGEPITPSRAEIITRAGGLIACYYAASECGHLGLGCADPLAVDDVHVLTDKMALIRREKATSGDGGSVGALYWTTLLPTTPKLMLNVEIGDMGDLCERDCSCPLGAIGYRQHLHTIRSYEKLTTEGMHFLGSELLLLVDSILPARFGGVPSDYQFVERDEGGLPTVHLIVSPRVGDVDDATVIETVLDSLGSHPGGNRMMATYWRDGRTVRVVRREPYVTAAAKVQPLHVVRSADERSV